MPAYLLCCVTSTQKLTNVFISDRFLARSYAAEALSMLSRAGEATETLQSERELLAMAEDYAREAKIQVCEVLKRG